MRGWENSRLLAGSLWRIGAAMATQCANAAASEMAQGCKCCARSPQVGVRRDDGAVRRSVLHLARQLEVRSASNRISAEMGTSAYCAYFTLSARSPSASRPTTLAAPSTRTHQRACQSSE